MINRYISLDQWFLFQKNPYLIFFKKCNQQECRIHQQKHTLQKTCLELSPQDFPAHYCAGQVNHICLLLKRCLNPGSIPCKFVCLLFLECLCSTPHPKLAENMSKSDPCTTLLNSLFLRSPYQRTQPGYRGLGSPGKPC